MNIENENMCRGGFKPALPAAEKVSTGLIRYLIRRRAAAVKFQASSPYRTDSVNSLRALSTSAISLRARKELTETVRYELDA